MSGLDSPRGLAFDPTGALYVAEAGRGAGVVSEPLTDPRCFVVSTGSRFCYGPTGAITRLWRGTQEQIATGLPSFAFPGKGNRGMGPADIGFLGRSAYVTIGLESDPATRTSYPEIPALAAFGSLVHLPANGGARIISDIGQFEIDNNPDGGAVDTDPFGILVEPGARIVADSGANDLVRIAANGEITLLATFPSRSSIPPRPSGVKTPATSDAVPTTVVKGPDGAYYIGELSGMPFTVGLSNIYRLDPETDAVPHDFKVGEAFLTGFKTIIDMAFDEDGSLYVLQHATLSVMSGPGILVRVVPDMTQPDIKAQYQHGTRTTVIGNLPAPTSVAIGPEHEIYLSIRGTTAGGGEVIRLPAVQ
ncbi:MAG TPA: ScyD/ScyE family protein [Vicinamibacterales bacterium]|nr:ScyD/ScyE family protein [Vicinamibacterales bacterium]